MEWAIQTVSNGDMLKKFKGLRHVNNWKKKLKIMWVTEQNGIRQTILAVKISLPRRANRPRPSEDALRCAGQASPSARIPCQLIH